MRLPTFAGLVAGAAVIVVPATASSAACRHADLAVTPYDHGQTRTAVLCLVNAERSRHGLPRLRSDPRLTAAAQAHTDDMVRRRYFAHLSPGGIGPGTQASGAGYPWATIEENIASAAPTPRSVMATWMASPGHCRNILSPSVVEVGVGASAGAVPGAGTGGTWTQIFGRRRTVGAPSSDTRAQSACPLGGRPTGGGGGVSRQTTLVASVGGSEVLKATAAIRGRAVSVRGSVARSGDPLRIEITVSRGSLQASRTPPVGVDGAFQAQVTAPAGTARIRVSVAVPGVTAVAP